MAFILPSNGFNSFPTMIPSVSTAGSAITPSTPSGTVPMLVMNQTCVGIYNASDVEVVAVLVPTGNDHTNTITVKIPARSAFRDFPFNAVIVSGSTGHALTTTHYLGRF